MKNLSSHFNTHYIKNWAENKITISDSYIDRTQKHYTWRYKMRLTVKIVVLDMTGTFLIKDVTRQDWNWFFHRGILIEVWQGRTALWTGSLPTLARPLAWQLDDAVCLNSLLKRLSILPEEVLWVSNDAERARETRDNEGFQVLDISKANTLDRDEIAREIMRVQGDGH